MSWQPLPEESCPCSWPIMSQEQKQSAAARLQGKPCKEKKMSVMERELEKDGTKTKVKRQLQDEPIAQAVALMAAFYAGTKKDQFFSATRANVCGGGKAIGKVF